jgi:hypothetical protein
VSFGPVVNRAGIGKKRLTRGVISAINLNHIRSYIFGGNPKLVCKLPLKRIDERRMRVWLREL